MAGPLHIPGISELGHLPARGLAVHNVLRAGLSHMPSVFLLIETFSETNAPRYQCH